MKPFLRNSRDLYHWLLAALTETAVAVPWLLFSYSLLGGERWPDALPGIWLLLAAYLAAGAWEAGTRMPAAVAARARVIAMVVGMAVVYLIAFYSAPPELTGPYLLKMNVALAVVPVTGYLWFQGARNAAERLSYGFVFDRFAWQCAILVAGVLLLIPAGAFRDGRVQVLLFWSVILVFTAGLTLLVATRERSLRQDQHKLGEGVSGEGGSTRLLTGLVLILLLLTLTASRILSVDRLNAVVGVFKGIVGAVGGWLTDVAMLIVYRLVLIFVKIFGPLAKAVMGILQRSGLIQMDPAESPIDPAKFEGPASIERMLPYVQIGLIVLGVLLLGLLLYKMSQSIRQHQLEDEEERVSLGFWASMMADLQAAFRAPAGSGVVRAVEERLDPRNPRALYRRLQTWGERRGRPRESAETPNAYQGVLAGQHPTLEGPVGVVTAVYNQARYGAQPPGPERVEQAVSALGQVESARVERERTQ